MICAMANVGKLQGNVTLIPGAAPDDGLLDLYIASPHRFRHWVKLGLRLITRRPKKDDQVDQRKGKIVRVKIHGKDIYQLDGDVVGEGSNLTAEVQPDALTICTPPWKSVSGAPAARLPGELCLGVDPFAKEHSWSSGPVHAGALALSPPRSSPAWSPFRWHQRWPIPMMAICSCLRSSRQV